MTWGEFVAAAARALGRDPLRIALPVATARLVALAAEGVARLQRKAAVLNRDRVRELAQHCWVCDTGAALDLGFLPRFSLQTGVNHTVSWMRKEQWI